MERYKEEKEFGEEVEDDVVEEKKEKISMLVKSRVPAQQHTTLPV